MISWIKGDVITLWQNNNKFFILINCHNLGYEIQILESIYVKLKKSQISDKNIILWLKHIKKEDSDSLYGFITKDQKDFFNEILNIKGIGSQIGMSMLNKFSINEIVDAINSQDKRLISSVQGIGQKMTERIILELKSKISTKITAEVNKKNTELHSENKEIDSLFVDLNLTLQSLNYPKKEIKKVLTNLMKDIKNNKFSLNDKNNITFENILKEAMNYLDKINRNLGL